MRAIICRNLLHYLCNRNKKYYSNEREYEVNVKYAKKLLIYVTSCQKWNNRGFPSLKSVNRLRRSGQKIRVCYFLIGSAPSCCFDHFKPPLSHRTIPGDSSQRFNSEFRNLGLSFGSSYETYMSK